MFQSAGKSLLCETTRGNNLWKTTTTTMTWRSWKTRVPVSQPTCCTGSLRTHMNHGGAAFMTEEPKIASGPRQSLQLGLPSAKASQNILRLLESSHGVNSFFAKQQSLDAYSPSFHPKSLIWSKKGKEWKAVQVSQTSETAEQFPTISSLQFSDDKTALAKLTAMDGGHRYVSLLQVNDDDNDPQSGPSASRIANDGWVIVREIRCPSPEDDTPASLSDQVAGIQSIVQCLQAYLDIEHGGGSDDLDRAKRLFHPEASLLCVGMAPVDEPSSDWSAPVGSFLEISLETYFEGVASQTPHVAESRARDSIMQVDITGDTAVATIRVGNGARTLTFVDHLFLGKNAAGEWNILSKVFSPQPW